MTTLTLATIPDLPGAACVGADVDLWHAPEGERPEGRARREAAAKAICAACPVQAACLAWALAADERHGIWGGKTEQQRDRMPERQPRQPRRARCGTMPGVQRHRRLGEPLCNDCLEERRRKDRARVRPQKARPRTAPVQRPECGTNEGWQAHRSRNEKMCAACRRSPVAPAVRPEKKPRPIPECGTVGGYARHRRLGEDVCEPCRAAKAAYAESRRRAAGQAPKKVAECGTLSGRSAHRRRGEPVCEACKAARRAHAARYKAARRGQAVLA